MEQARPLKVLWRLRSSRIFTLLPWKPDPWICQIVWFRHQLNGKGKCKYRNEKDIINSEIHQGASEIWLPHYQQFSECRATFKFFNKKFKSPLVLWFLLSCQGRILRTQEWRHGCSTTMTVRECWTTVTGCQLLCLFHDVSMRNSRHHMQLPLWHHLFRLIWLLTALNLWIWFPKTCLTARKQEIQI